MAGLPLLGDNINSRQTDEEERRKLISQENSLTDAIINHHGTMSQLVRDLALVVEQRININDCDFAVSEISTYITRQLRQVQCAYADTVRQVLPDKYKNPDLAGFGKIGSIFRQLEESGGVMLRQPLGECSNGELESYLQFLKKAKNECSDKLGTFINNKINDVRGEALRRGINLDEEVYRSPISVYDFKYPVPEHLWPKIHKTIEYGIAGAKAEEEFFTKIYANFPAAIEEDVDKHLNAAKTWATFMKSVIEMKWSFDYGGWFDRNYWNDAQSAHKAGNSSKFPTNLCAYCSRDIDNDPKDFHVMTYDKDSPTRMRCDNCKGTEVLDRGTSREQVGDKHDEVDRMSRDIVNHIEHYYDLYKDTREKYLNHVINSRKRAISNEFRIASFGKEKIVVAKKKGKEKEKEPIVTTAPRRDEKRIREIMFNAEEK